MILPDGCNCLLTSKKIHALKRIENNCKGLKTSCTVSTPRPPAIGVSLKLNTYQCFSSDAIRNNHHNRESTGRGSDKTSELDLCNRLKLGWPWAITLWSGKTDSLMSQMPNLAQLAKRILALTAAIKKRGAPIAFVVEGRN